MPLTTLHAFKLLECVRRLPREQRSLAVTVVAMISGDDEVRVECGHLFDFQNVKLNDALLGRIFAVSSDRDVETIIHGFLFNHLIGRELFDSTFERLLNSPDCGVRRLSILGSWLGVHLMKHPERASRYAGFVRRLAHREPELRVEGIRLLGVLPSFTESDWRLVLDAVFHHRGKMCAAALSGLLQGLNRPRRVSQGKRAIYRSEAFGRRLASLKTARLSDTRFFARALRERLDEILGNNW